MQRGAAASATRSWACISVGALALAGAPGCGSVPAPEPAAAARAPAPASLSNRGSELHLVVTALDGTVVTSEELRGRLTVIGVVASFDPASQTQALVLRSLIHHHAPRINVALLVLEPEANRPMVEAFAAALDAPFVVALVDTETLAGRGPLGDVREVPTLLVLDRACQEAWRHVGQVDESSLDQVLRHLDEVDRQRGP
jgi:hypothetical protein